MTIQGIGASPFVQQVFSKNVPNKQPRFSGVQDEDPAKYVEWACSDNETVRGEGIKKLSGLKDVPQIAQSLKSLSGKHIEAAQAVFSKIRTPLVQSELLQLLTQSGRDNASDLANQLVDKVALSSDTLNDLIGSDNKKASQLAIRSLSQSMDRLTQFIRPNQPEAVQKVTLSAFSRLPEAQKINVLGNLFEKGNPEFVGKALAQEPGLTPKVVTELHSKQQKLIQEHKAEIRSYEQRISDIHQSHSEDLRTNYSRKSDWEIWRDSDMTR